MRMTKVKSHLAYIKSHLSFLPKYIQQLEEAGLPLSSSLEILEKARVRIDSMPGQKGDVFKSKLSQVLKKNSALEILKKIDQVSHAEATELPEGMSPSQVAASFVRSPLQTLREASVNSKTYLLTDGMGFRKKIWLNMPL